MRFDDRAEAVLIAATQRIAEEEILPRFRALDGGDIDSKRDADDLVTIADKRSEERLTDALRQILPGAEIVGEEAVSVDKSILSRVGESELCAVIDPIDGTWNYANGLGNFGVILAILEGGQTVWGGLYDPLGDHWIIGRKGQGAWTRDRHGKTRPVHVGEGPDKSEDAFGLIPLFLFDGDDKRGLAAAYPDFRRVGSLRCSCHEYRLLSQGRADFGLSTILNVWDHAAGQLIFQEAGGVSRLLNGSSYDPTMTHGRLLVARSEPLWHAVAERLQFLA